MKTKQPGFILLTVFFLLAIAAAIVTQIYYRGMMHTIFMPVVTDREKAKILAQSGIAIAINQLALHDTKLTPESDQKTAGKGGDGKKKDP